MYTGAVPADGLAYNSAGISAGIGVAECGSWFRLS